LGCFVGARVVHDQMKVQVERKLSIESAEKLQNFLVTVALGILRSRFPRAH
jgi:hypothetical protein